MASSISAPEVPSAGGQMYYCHQCSHQWRKTENSDFSCPQCRQGFIEEINDNGSAQSDRVTERESHPIYSLINRIISDLEPARPRTSHTSRRVRSRSPRMFVVGSSNRDTEPSSPFRQHLVDSTVHFDLDDFMSSFLSSQRSHPVSERRLLEIPKETITLEQESAQCSICFDEFKVGEITVRKLPCNHLFHENCIFPWLRLNGTCPVCRARLNPGADEEQSNAASPASFDNILRFMRFRRNSIRRVRERNEASTSAGTRADGSGATLPLESIRRRRPTVESRRAGISMFTSGRPARFRSSNISLRSNPILADVVETQMPANPGFGMRVTRSQTIPTVDLTSDTEILNLTPMAGLDSSSSSSSSSDGSSSTYNTMSLISTISSPSEADNSDGSFIQAPGPLDLSLSGDDTTDEE